MDIYDLILNFHKTRNIKYYVTYFRENKSDIGELVKVIIQKKEYPFPEYGSWLLIHITKADASVVLPFRNQLVDMILDDHNQSVLRNVAKILEYLGYLDYRETELLDRFISFIESNENKVALQVYSMYCLVPFVKKYPELKEEITALIQLTINEKSPAYKSAFKSFLKRTKKST